MRLIWNRLKDFWHYRDLLKQLIIRDIKLKYRRSFLGYLWSVLNPLFLMLVMTIVFSQMFRRNIENFPVYLFTGQLLFNFMNQSTHQSLTVISGNAALLKKAYIPKYIFVFSKITSGLVDFFFSCVALVIVMLVTHARFSGWNLLFIVVALQLYGFCLGLGLFLAQANVFFRDIQYIYNVVTTAWMYLTPVFYPLESLPSQLQWGIRHWNPMYFYVEQFRQLVYYNCLPDAGLVIAGMGTALLVLVVGAVCFKRTQDRFILYT